MSTFTNTMADIILELNDREIYTDIRSETSDTKGFETAYSVRELGCWFSDPIPPGQTREFTFYARSGDTEITWLDIVSIHASGVTIPGTDITEAACIAIGGEWHPQFGIYGAYCGSLDLSRRIQVKIIYREADSITVEIKNRDTTWPPGITGVFYIKYRYLDLKIVTVRAVDEVCIEKYGRRVMKLVWPLGQSIEQMQSFMNAYLERHKEPVPTATVRIQGRTPELIEQILTRKVSDRITIQHTILGIASDFFINSIDIIHDVEGLLEATWQVEQVRDMEMAGIFTLDISELSGPDILGW